MNRSLWLQGAALSFLLAVGACSQSSDDIEESFAPATETGPAAGVEHAIDRTNRFQLELGEAVAVSQVGAVDQPALVFATRADLSRSTWHDRADLQLAPTMPVESSCHLRDIDLPVGPGNSAPAIEAWCERSDAVEHAYQFASRPTVGDLVVEVDVNGPAPIVTSGDRVEWRSANGLTTRYGKAAWIDADGRRFPVKMSWREGGAGAGTIRLAVAAEVLAESAYPAVLDPTLGAWSLVSEAVLRPSTRTAGIRSAAALGNDLAVFFSSEWVKVSATGVVSPSLQGGASGGLTLALPAATGVLTVATGDHSFLGTDGVWRWRAAILPESQSIQQPYGAGVVPGGFETFGRPQNLPGNAKVEKFFIAANGHSTALGPLTAGGQPVPSSVNFIYSVYVTSTNTSLVASESGNRVIRRGNTTQWLPPVIFGSGGFIQASAMNDADVIAVTLAGTSGFTLATVTPSNTVQQIPFAGPGVPTSVAAGHGSFVMARDNGATSTAVQRFGPNGLEPPQTVPTLTSPQVTSYPGGFVLTGHDAGRPMAILLNQQAQPVNPNADPIPLLYDEQRREGLAFFYRDDQSQWAIWRDDRDEANPSLFARAVDWDGVPLAASEPTGDALSITMPVPYDAATTVRTDTRGLSVWQDPTTYQFRGVFGDVGSLSDFVITNVAEQRSHAPLLLGSTPAVVSREQITSCNTPPCRGQLVIHREGVPNADLSLGFDDVLEVWSAGSHDTTTGVESWVVASGVIAGKGELRAVGLDVTGAVSTNVFVDDLSAPGEVLGIDGEPEGGFVIAWRGSFGNDVTIYRVAPDGAVTVLVLTLEEHEIDGRSLVALGAGRGYLLDERHVSTNGDMDKIQGFGDGRVTGATTDGRGNVLIGRQSFEMNNTFEVAHLFVGEAQGAPCTDNDQCGTGFCQEGICCEAECGLCERCDQSEPGRCELAINTDDDSCFGDRTCDGEGECRPSNGQSCTVPSDCASGFCVEGVCCDSACEDSCGECRPGFGICTIKDCGAFGCDGGGVCKQICDSTVDCGVGFVCTSDGECVTPSGPPVEEEGCGCRVAGAAPNAPGRGMWLMFGCALAVSLRRRSKLAQHVSRR